MSAPLCIAYGFILINSDAETAMAVIRSLGRDEDDWAISTSMFTPSDCNDRSYYDQLVIGYAASYSGNLIRYWKKYLLKLEHLLRQLDFETAAVHVDAGYYGDLDFFWAKRPEADEMLASCYQDKNHQFYRTDEWYFGYGKRDAQIGMLDETVDNDLSRYQEHYPYPVRIKDKVIDFFNAVISGLPHNRAGEMVHLLKHSDFPSNEWEEIAALMTRLQLEKIIRPHLGLRSAFWIEQPVPEQKSEAGQRCDFR